LTTLAGRHDELSDGLLYVDWYYNMYVVSKVARFLKTKAPFTEVTREVSMN